MNTTTSIDGKALSVTPRPDGDIILRGIVATWEIDRQNEAFDVKAFDQSISKFLAGSASVFKDHRKDQLLGKVLKLERRPDGLWGELRIDGDIATHPELGVTYRQIKRGSLRGASVGGFFRRQGNKIVQADLVEISVTGAPVGGHTTSLDVVQDMKALTDRLAFIEMGVIEREVERLSVELDALLQLRQIEELMAR